MVNWFKKLYVVDKVFISFISLLAVPVFYGFSVAAVGARTSELCLEAAVSSSTVTWNYKSYCIARTLQGDYVIPLQEVLDAFESR